MLGRAEFYIVHEATAMVKCGDPRHNGSKLSAKYCAATSHSSARFFGLRAIMSPAFGDPASLSASEMLTPLISSPGSYGRSSAILFASILPKFAHSQSSPFPNA
jgi:hypothetical protein